MIHKVGTGVVQSVILKRSLFSPEKARAFVIGHHYKAYKMDTTPEYYRFRQIDPSALENAGFRFRNVPLGKEGYLVIAYPHKKQVK